MTTKDAIQVDTERPTQPERLSFAEYLGKYNSIEGMRTEWNAGIVEHYKVTNNVKHEQIIIFLTILLHLYLSRRGIGLLVGNSVPMYVGDDKPSREPDLTVVLTANRERIRPTYVDGVADLVVEVVSPESTERDRGIKFVEYEAAGVPEYWLIDPVRSEASVYVLGEDKHYFTQVSDANGRLQSAILPSFAFSPEMLWRETVPSGTELIALVEAME